MNHTQGNWRIHVNYPHSIVGQRMGGKAYTILAETFGNKTEREANAILIAAAPKLLELLTTVLYVDQSGDKYDKRVKEAKMYVQSLGRKLRK